VVGIAVITITLCCVALRCVALRCDALYFVVLRIVISSTCAAMKKGCSFCDSSIISILSPVPSLFLPTNARPASSSAGTDSGFTCQYSKQHAKQQCSIVNTVKHLCVIAVCSMRSSQARG
jgi:hypothetical protein